MSRLPSLLLVLSCVLSATTCAFAQLPRWYSCLKTVTPPVIDGDLNEEVWNTAPWSEPFIDIRDTSYPAPEYETRFKMLWDDNYLYVGAWLQEPHLRAHLGQRDTVIFFDNDFEIFIDPDGDHHDYGELEVNAKNVHWDLMLTEPYQNHYQAIDAWDIRDLKKAVGLYGTLNDPSDIDSGWVVEWAIPMLTILEMYCQDSLVTPGVAWKINYSRVQWPVEVRNGEYLFPVEPWEADNALNWVWSPQGRVNMHLPEKWGLVILETHEMQSQELPDSIATIEELRYDLMRIYHRLRRYSKDNEHGPETLQPFIGDLTFLRLDPHLVGFSGTRYGFELTYPIDDRRTIRLTDDRRFRIEEPDDE